MPNNKNVSNSDLIEIAHRLRDARIKAKMRSNFIADCVGITEKFYLAIENGSKTPSFPTFVTICKTLNCDVNYVLYGTTEIEPYANLQQKDIEFVQQFISFLVNRSDE